MYCVPVLHRLTLNSFLRMLMDGTAVITEPTNPRIHCLRFLDMAMIPFTPIQEFQEMCTVDVLFGIRSGFIRSIPSNTVTFCICTVKCCTITTVTAKCEKKKQRLCNIVTLLSYIHFKNTKVVMVWKITSLPQV